MRIYSYNLILAFVFASLSPLASAAIDDNAATVLLRTSCTENNTALDNCFQTTNELSIWMLLTRRPNAAAPLKVDMGPGTFGRLAITCDPANGYTGHISFQGSGPDQSKFSYAAGGNGPFGIIDVRNCTNMAFSDLKVEATPVGFAYGYIEWRGGGTSHWNNVLAIVSARGWQEPECGATKGQHYWFSSRFVSHAVINIGKAYESSCDDSWFFGSEITFTTELLGTFGAALPATYHTLIARNGTELHVYGSVIRALAPAPSGSTSDGSLNIVTATTNGQIHIHGTGIDGIAGDAKNIVALAANTGGFIHANVSSYVLSTVGGAVTRIANNGGDVRAPYMWYQQADPPAISSVTGADTAVITNTSDGQPHLVVYSTNCPSGWFDTTAVQCRP